MNNQTKITNSKAKSEIKYLKLVVKYVTLYGVHLVVIYKHKIIGSTSDSCMNYEF